jgi:hypothetical protein
MSSPSLGVKEEEMVPRSRGSEVNHLSLANSWLKKEKQILFLRINIRMSRFNRDPFNPFPDVTPKPRIELEKKKEVKVNLPEKHNSDDYFLEVIMFKHPELIRRTLWSNSRISLEFLEANAEIVDWDEAGRHPKMNKNFVNKHFENHPELWSFYQYQTENVLRLSPHKISKLEKEFRTKPIPRELARPISSSNFREKFIESHLEELDWFYLSSNPHLQVTFFERHIEKVVWSEVCLNTALPSTFFEEHIEKVDWSMLCRNTIIPESFFRENIEKVDFEAICLNTSISEAFYRDNLETINHNKNKKKCWMWLSRHTSCSEAFFRKNFKFINWEQISSNSSLSPSFFLENLDKIDPYKFCTNNFDYFVTRNGRRIDYLFKI